MVRHLPLSGPDSRAASLPAFPIKEKFLEASQRFYGAKPALLSGNSQADLEAINRWVEEATNGQISTMLTELPPNIVMVLLNAVYFRGESPARLGVWEATVGDFFQAGLEAEVLQL